jgi:DNA (cytosine-5)-methyltransferase 1
MSREPMRIGSLFSGIGGLELGLEWAGVGHTIWQVEQDPFCRDVLAQHWPDATRFNDVREVGAHNLEPVDVICGGFPCQDVSTLGKRAGMGEGTRSGLWVEFARIIGELSPSLVIVENTRGLESLGLHLVLADLRALGYRGERSFVPACAVGAPHTRSRLFILAYASRQRVGGHWTTGATGPTAGGWSHHAGGAQGASEWRSPDAPGVQRVVDGIPTRMDRDRTRALGNAVVPHVAEVVGRRLMQLAAEQGEVAA